MDWTAKLDQRQNALLLTFFMLVAMVLVIVREGLDRRGAAVSHSLGAQSFAPHDNAPVGFNQLSPIRPDQADHFDQLYTRTLVLLCAARLVARLLMNTMRETYELMKLADVVATSLRDVAHMAAQRLAPEIKPFDTS